MSQESTWKDLPAPDLYLLGLTLIAAVTIPSIRKIVPRVIAHYVLAFSLALYYLMTLLGTIFAVPLNLADLIKYLPEGRAITNFIEWHHLLLLASVMLLWRWRILLNQPARASILVFGCVFIAGGGLLEPPSEIKSRIMVPFRSPDIRAELHQYSPESIADLQNDWSKHNEVALPAGVHRIILVVVESLSAEDSFRTSGLLNRLPRLDQWSQDGMLFTNFIANYSDSEGGLVALLNGVPPVPYPGSSHNLYRSFKYRPSLVQEINRRGFHTEFLSTSPLSFRDGDEFLDAIGYQMARGVYEVATFRSAPKGSFNSPADAYLYEEALKRIDILEDESSPYFLTLVTTSSHLPLVDPEGRGNNPDNVWEYVDRQLSQFYTKLKKSGFFDHGVLMVTSDHRKMYPRVSEEMRQRYAASSVACIPLVVVGQGIPEGKTDHRLFQQSDLLRRMGNIAHPESTLTPLATYVERSSFHYADIGTYGGLRIIAPDGAVFPANVQGALFNWEGHRPLHATTFERALHAQRSENQYLRQHSKMAWRPRFMPSKRDRKLPGEQPGLQVELYEDTDINGMLNSDSSRYLHSLNVAQLDYPDLSTLLDDATENYSFRITGYIHCLKEGRYDFRIESDDGSGLAINQRVVVDANFPKSFGPEDGTLFLESGYHKLELRYFQNGGRVGLRLSWKKPGDLIWEVIPAKRLSH